MAEPTTTQTATCLCKSSTLSFTIPTSSLPLPTHFCHCSICRHTHGTLCSIHAPIPPPVVDLSTFTAYRSSDRVVRYFCSTCGAHFGDCAREEGGEEQWYVAASIVDAPESTWEFGNHFHVAGTRDGGLATWVGEVGGKTMGCWRGKEDAGAWGPPESSSSYLGGLKNTEQTQDTPSKEEDKLHAHCHCGGISFTISRPRSSAAFSSLPPSFTPADKSKWYAIHDVCTSCRLTTGCAIVSWAFPEVSHIALSDGSPYTPIFGTTKCYQSSTGVLRTFCGRCGAAVAYACEDRPQMVDIAVGLLDGGEGGGVRLEDWLEWRTGKCAYEEDAVWRGVLAGLKEGLEKWGEGRGG